MYVCIIITGLSFVSRLHMSKLRETVDPSWFYISQSLMFRHDEKLIFFMVLQNKTKKWMDGSWKIIDGSLNIILKCFTHTELSQPFKFVQNYGSVTASLNAFLPVLPYPGKFEIYPGKPWWNPGKILENDFQNKWQPRIVIYIIWYNRPIPMVFVSSSIGLSLALIVEVSTPAGLTSIRNVLILLNWVRCCKFTDSAVLIVLSLCTLVSESWLLSQGFQNFHGKSCCKRI